MIERPGKYMTDNELLITRLNKILDKPVWEGRLEEITPKQLSYLKMMCDVAEGKISETSWAYRSDYLDVIKNIIHPRVIKFRSPQTEAYLQIKKII